MSSQPTATASVPFTIDNIRPGPLAFGNSPDLYRIRLQPEHSAGGPTIKYLTAPNSSRTLTGPDAHLRRRNNLAFDSVPAGDWIVGRLVITEEGQGDDTSQRGKLKLASTEPAGAETADILHRLGLCSVEPMWCSTTIDEADCRLPPATTTSDWTTVVTAADGNEVTIPKPTDLQCMDYVSASVIPAPTGIVTGDDAQEEVVRVSDWLPGHWAGIERETRAHQIIQARDPSLAPRFLAHMTENSSRVVGFLLEHVPDAREAGLEDLEKCRAALARLHALGIVKAGELKRHSFLVKKDGSVVIRGPFTHHDPAEESVDDLGEVMEAELDSLETVLAQSPSEFEDQSARLLRLVDPRRTKMLGEFERAHGLVVRFAYWQESSEGGGRITLTVEEHGVLAKEFEENGFRWTSELQQRAEERFGLSAKGV